MLNVGLTGGIAAGKSTAGEIFSEFGAVLIDSDQLAREVVNPGAPALIKIVEHFGESVLMPDGQLNRRYLREKIFNDPFERKWLENLLHPLIRETMAHAITQSSGPYQILLIPLIVNQPPNPLLHRICVIDTEPHLQMERVIDRDNITPEQASQIIAVQAKREELLAAANDVLVNTGHLDDLREQIYKLHEKYLAIAS